MKKTAVRLLTASLLAIGAGPASAGDIPSAANNWNGIFVSASVGYGSADSKAFVEPNSDDYHPDGVTGTVGLGYDIMVRDTLLLGVFGDYTFGELDDGFNLNGIPGEGTLDNTWAIGGRIGTIISKDLLVYGTVGYTRTDFTLGSPAGSATEELDGVFVGAGLERVIYNNLYLKGEYRYSHFEDASGITDPPGCAGNGCDFNFENDTHSIRVGLAYKFGGRREDAVPLK